MPPPEIRNGASEPLRKRHPKSSEQLGGRLNQDNSNALPDFQAWPDLHDHILQLADAGILPDMEDYA
jgi:hypothetical protein